MIDTVCIKTINELIVELEEQEKKYYPRILKSLQIPSLFSAKTNVLKERSWSFIFNLI